ncbi:hypothetical protein V5F53_08515 [Xanthobacter sp. V4C-4]|uniref:hypothetical protein n=1 Tax=Xanthobacter cornucopiae TaxID=3119924 RepID=UPI00372C04B1
MRIVLRRRSTRVPAVALGRQPGQWLGRALLVALLAGGAAADTARAAGRETVQAPPGELRAQATGHLKFLYTMYFAIRACTEAAQEQFEPAFRPTVSLAEAQRVLKAADASARSVGVDVDRAWLEMSPIGQAAGEALKQRSADAFKKCQQSGMFFRTATSKLQLVITQMNGTVPLIEKDF